jgi:hypothetical protein
MTGYPNWNYDTFNAAAQRLRAAGHEVFNPAENDNGSSGKPREFYLRLDVKAVASAEAVAVLPGWERSEGASLEVHIARHLAMPVYHAETMEPVDAQGRKDDSDKLRFDLIDGGSLTDLARVYTFGARKYTDRNWEKGIQWSRVFGAVMRHMWAFWNGQDLDPETGLPHTIHAAWGCFALTNYLRNRKQFDDRPKEEARATQDPISDPVLRPDSTGTVGRPNWRISNIEGLRSLSSENPNYLLSERAAQKREQSVGVANVGTRIVRARDERLDEGSTVSFEQREAERMAQHEPRANCS